MKVFICENEIKEQNKLEKLIQSILPQSELNTIKKFSSPDDAAKFLKENENDYPNILILNVKYKNGNDGILFATMLKKTHKDIIVIFVSQYKEKVFESFCCEPFCFIPKPYKNKDLTEVIGRAVDKINHENAHLNVRWNGQENSIRIDTIKYVEYMNKRLTFHTFDGVYKTIGTLSNLFERLKKYGFVRTHQSFIVNMNMIKKFDRNEVVLIDDTTVMLSLRKKAKVLKEYSKYLLGIRKEEK